MSGNGAPSMRKRRGKKYRTMKNFLKLLTLLMMVMFVSAAPAAAAEDDYYYPGYDPAVEGYVDLMQYMTGITMSVVAVA